MIVDEQELVCSGVVLEDDWRLGDCLDVTADEQRLTLRLRSPRVRLELFGARHWLPDSLTHDQLAAVLHDSPIIYVVPRCYFGDEPDDTWSKDTAFPAAFAADRYGLVQQPTTLVFSFYRSLEVLLVVPCLFCGMQCMDAIDAPNTTCAFLLPQQLGTTFQGGAQGRQLVALGN